MWTARAFRGDQWVPHPVSEVRGPFTSSRTLQALRELKTSKPQSAALRYLGQEVETPGLSRDAIEFWATLAQAESREYAFAGGGSVEALEEAIGLTVEERSESSIARPDAIAWHDHSAVLVPVTESDQEIELTYMPEVVDQIRAARLRHRYALPDQAMETILDWRGYFGAQSAVIDGWRLMRGGGRGFVASIRGTAGFVVGNVLRRLSAPQPNLTSDPTMIPRLASMVQKYPLLVANFPEIESLAPTALPTATVFVHGTLSCAFQGLKDLHPNGARVEPTFRFEHDTFRPLQENGHQLGKLILERVRAKRLLLLAHSRGGLVARYARTHLLHNGYAGEIHLFTFGTPHKGTPLVQAGRYVLNAFLKISAELFGAVPMLSPLVKAYSILWDMPDLPPGIESMGEGSSELAAMNTFDIPDQVRAWGGDFDISAAPSGFSADVEGLLGGLLNGRRHDLVVPTSSALGFGVAAQVLRCSHSHYFLDPSVRATVTAFQASTEGVGLPSQPRPATVPPAAMPITATPESLHEKLRRMRPAKPVLRKKPE